MNAQVDPRPVKRNLAQVRVLLIEDGVASPQQLRGELASRKVDRWTLEPSFVHWDFVALEARRAARALLKAGGCVIIFPGGAVSTSRRPFGPAVHRLARKYAGVPGAGKMGNPNRFGSVGVAVGRTSASSVNPKPEKRPIHRLCIVDEDGALGPVCAGDDSSAVRVKRGGHSSGKRQQFGRRGLG